MKTAFRSRQTIDALMKRKTAIGVICLLFLFVMSLFLTSKISDAYGTAIRKVLSDPAVEQEYGRQQFALLIGSQFKLGPQWSCARLLFILSGADGKGIVEVLLRRKKLRDAWAVREVIIGYHAESKVDCGSTI